MTQSELFTQSAPPADAGLHVAIIMDGSGRWAERRGWPRSAGHRAGAAAVERVVRTAPGLGIGTLTLFAFSGANWRRPPREQAALMDIFARFFESASRDNSGVRLSVIGRRDRLARALVEGIERAERATAAGRRMRLRVAIDYSAREALVAAARGLHGLAATGGEASKRGLSEQQFARALAEAMHETEPAPEIDLLIRTGGEQRLSDCVLWEGSFAEIVFSATLWPDFGEEHLTAALDEFRRRERRFGGATQAAS